MSNNFFDNNAIENYKTFSTSFRTTTHGGYKSTPKIKRVTSVCTARINPEKFLNRQAFNNKLYSEKPFNIAVEFRKQKEQEYKRFCSFKENENCSLINKYLSSKNKENFDSTLINLAHFFTTLYKLNNNQANEPNTVKSQLICLKQSIQRLLNIFAKQLQSKQSKYLSLLCTQKSLPQRFSSFKDSKPQSLQRGSNILRLKTSIYASKNNGTKEYPQQNFENRKGQSSKILSKLSNSQRKVIILTQKVNALEFETKKKTLFIQKLQQQNQQKSKQIELLHQKIQQIQQKVSKVKEIEQFYTYKIKKLKEELQVAHIVKDQNLREKMEFILGK